MGGQNTMNRVIHAAVRRDLTRLDDALGRAADGDVARARRLQLAFANLHHQLQRHHHGEDRFIYPFVAALEPAAELLGEMDDEHRAMADALAETRAAMDAYAATASAADAAIARRSVVRTAGVIGRHLDHEEHDFEPLVLPHLDSKEWKAVEKQVRGSSLSEAGNFFAWLQDGMSDEDRAFLRATVPPPVTFLLSRLAGRTYRREVAPVWSDGVTSASA